MATTYYGRGAFLGIAEESTWGTAVSPRTNFLRILDGEVTREIAKETRNPMYRSGTTPSSLSHYIKTDDTKGRVRVECSYGSLGILWKHALGSVSSSGVGPYTHTHVLAATLPTGLTLAFDAPTGTSEVIEGGKIANLRVSWSPGGQVIAEFDFVGQTTAGPESGATPTYVTEDPVLHHHAGTFDWNSASYTIRSGTITHANTLEMRRYMGSKLTAEPLKVGTTTEISFSMEIDDAWQTAIIADTESDGTFRFTKDSNTWLDFAVQNAYIVSVGKPINVAGLLMSNVVLRGQGDGSDHGFKITNKNANSSAVAN